MIREVLKGIRLIRNIQLLSEIATPLWHNRLTYYPSSPFWFRSSICWFLHRHNY